MLTATLSTKFPILTEFFLLLIRNQFKSNSFSFEDILFPVYCFDSLFLWFHQFYFEVSRFGFLFIYHTWSLQNIFKICALNSSVWGNPQPLLLQILPLAHFFSLVLLEAHLSNMVHLFTVFSVFLTFCSIVLILFSPHFFYLVFFWSLKSFSIQVCLIYCQTQLLDY